MESQTVGALELADARHGSPDDGGGETYKFFHGTSWTVAQQILQQGFRTSADGCLGPGIYVARREKAERFAQEASRHGECVGGLVEVLVTVRHPKFVQGNDSSWQAQGFDACRANSTTASTNMEWCIRSASQVRAVRIYPVRCTNVAPSDEERELERHAAKLEADVLEQQQQLHALRSWQNERRRERERREAEQEETEKRKQREREEEEAERKRIRLAEQHEDERRARGKCITYSLCGSDHRESVDRNFDSRTTCISTDGTATIMLHEGGSWSYSSAIPKLLHNKLNGRQRTLPEPRYVAIGTEDRYFISFVDGKSEWVGPDSMTRCLNASTRRVKTVAFGRNFESFFIVFEDGGWHYDDVPDGLIKQIEARQRKADLECVSLGPGGEWFLHAANGRAWWGGMASEDLEDVAKVKDSLMYLDFGVEQCWLCRYNK